MSTRKQERGPMLARGVRYRWDTIRREHHLLFPEGMLVLNETGAAILQRCDGRSIAEIHGELVDQFGDNAMLVDVIEYIDRLAARGLIQNDDR